MYLCILHAEKINSSETFLAYPTCATQGILSFCNVGSTVDY